MLHPSIHFHTLNHPCITGINLIWSWYIILLICYWIWFTRILLRIFACIHRGLWFSFLVMSSSGFGIKISFSFFKYLFLWVRESVFISSTLFMYYSHFCFACYHKKKKKASILSWPCCQTLFICLLWGAPSNSIFPRNKAISLYTSLMVFICPWNSF